MSSVRRRWQPGSIESSRSLSDESRAVPSRDVTLRAFHRGPFEAAMSTTVDDAHAAAAQLAVDVVVGGEQFPHVTQKLVSHDGHRGSRYASGTIWLRRAQAMANIGGGAHFRGWGFAPRTRLRVVRVVGSR